MKIQHRMICQPSCRISAVKFRGLREEKRGKEEGTKGGRKEKEDPRLWQDFFNNISPIKYCTDTKINPRGKVNKVIKSK